ncbi:DIC protein, partial [Podilymbus podiceps]|nr:DIC protein [Podilymbus podiceps]
EALAGAPLDTAAKEYSPKVRQLVRDIAGLTLLEVADLNALLKETLKIPDVGVMPAGAAALLPSQAAPQEEEQEVSLKKEKTHFTVRLTELKPADKVKLIKEVKNFVPGVNLVQAKKLVESLPQDIKANASKEEAEKIKAALEAAGGTTQQEVKMRMMGMAMRVIRTDGFLALYNGLSASLCRQMTYSLTRFAIYETARDRLGQGSQGPPPFYQKVLLGAVGGELCAEGSFSPGSLRLEEPPDPSLSLATGFTGGFVGTPADMVNVRSPRALTPPPLAPSSYSHALDGMYRVFREEGLRKLFSGATMASSRGALVTVGQLSCYDQAKQLVLTTGLLSDNIFTHFLASFIAGGCATFLCQPLDVLKTRLMNSQGEYRGVTHCAVETAKLGPLAFYKGFVPAAIRLIPHTVLTFVFLEQLRKYFGIKVIT